VLQDLHDFDELEVGFSAPATPKTEKSWVSRFRPHFGHLRLARSLDPITKVSKM